MRLKENANLFYLHIVVLSVVTSVDIIETKR